ncbi:protein kinase [Aureococcus anophagefferens]|nr:protein kinase [Aureococcus anophagefferens]
MTPPLSIGAAFQIAEGDLDIGDVIGSGAFGTVKAARWRHTPVAVKVLYHDARADDRQLFEKEVQLMATLHHPNIVQFLGYAHTPALALVLEIFENGSIEAYVPRRRPGVKRSRRFCADMARSSTSTAGGRAS